MNILKKANEIAALLKQASDIEVEAKKKAKKEETVEDLDLDAIPTPDLSDKSLDDLAAHPTEADAPAAGSAFTQLKDALLNATTPTAAVAQCKDAILGEINNDPELFDQQIKDLLMLVAKDPELKATDSASLQAALESIKPKKESKEEAPAAESPLPEDPTAAQTATDDDLANAAGDLPGSDVPGAPKKEENAVDELASMPNASLFEALKKTAFDVNELAGVQTEPTLEAKGLSADEKAAFDNWAASYLTIGSTVDADSIVSNYLNENHLPNTPEDRAPYIEYFNQNKTGSAHSTLLTKQEALDTFLKEAREYQAPSDPMDNVIKQAKAAASAEDFLQKIATAESILKTANTIDEKSNSPQHPGKKLFNDDVVSYTDGKQQYFPGQKVMQTRDGGNATVVSVFNFKGKPDVDVYNNKPARKNVTSINTKDGGTIAFFQPMHEEQTDITVPTDYTGVVTGEVQKKPEIKEQLAGAGHKVNDFMDEKFKLADKKKVAGDLPVAKASAKSGLNKKAEDRKKLSPEQINKELRAGHAYQLLEDRVITEQDGKLFEKAVDFAFAQGPWYRLLLDKIITRNNRQLYDRALEYGLANDSYAYMFDNDLVTREDGELYYSAVRQAMEHERYYDLLRLGYVKREDGPLFDEVVDAATHSLTPRIFDRDGREGAQTLFDEGIITKDELDAYNKTGKFSQIAKVDGTDQNTDQPEQEVSSDDPSTKQPASTTKQQDSQEPATRTVHDDYELENDDELADSDEGVPGEDDINSNAMYHFNGFKTEASKKKASKFTGLTKTAGPADMYQDSDTTSVGTSSLGTDSACGPKDTNLKTRPKTLTPEELMKARKDFEEKEGQIINTSASLEENAAPNSSQEAPKSAEVGNDTKQAKEAQDKPLNDPNTVDASQLASVEAAIKALPEDKQAQLKEVADSPTLFKQKLEEVWVMTNPGEPKPTLNDEGYKQVAKNLFNVEPQQNTLATPAKPSTDTKKSEKAPDGAKEAGKGAEAQDLDGLFKDLGL